MTTASLVTIVTTAPVTSSHQQLYSRTSARFSRAAFHRRRRIEHAARRRKLPGLPATVASHAGVRPAQLCDVLSSAAGSHRAGPRRVRRGDLATSTRSLGQRAPGAPPAHGSDCVGAGCLARKEAGQDVAEDCGRHAACPETGGGARTCWKMTTGPGSVTFLRDDAASMGYCEFQRCF